MRFLKVTITGFLLLVVLAAAFIAFHFYSNVPVTTEEVYRDDEVEQSERAANNFVNVIKESLGDYAARGAHAKGHACVKAYFEVETKLEEQLRHGVFSRPGQVFKSWIRFSNGASNLAKSEDGKNDSRGMAIKLINIQDSGLPLAENDSGEVQDFLMHNNPVFFSANIEDYNKLVESENKVLSFFDSANPFKWRIRELSHVFDTLAPPPYSPLVDEYFSNTAYKLGPNNIKFSAQPCEAGPESAEIPENNPDFLQQRLRNTLAVSEACFAFKVQLQDAEKYMPIEDPSIEWKQEDSPYRQVATIRIPQQAVDSPGQTQFCENLAFSPWHGLAAHRPIGELNRIRKQVYAASARYRHRFNNTRPPAQLDW